MLWEDKHGRRGHTSRRCIDRRSIDRLVAIMAFILLAATAGCSDAGPYPIAEVTGIVTYHDAPLGGGTVVFHPERDTPGPQATGSIGLDGAFRMKVSDRWGAAIGSHKVTVDYRRELTAAESRDLVIPELLIPPNYASVDTSPLRFTVEANADNTYRLVLED
jgi:hypothetical protein